MAIKKIDRLNARLNSEYQDKVRFLLDHGLTQIDLFKSAIDLMYDQYKAKYTPSANLILESNFVGSGKGASDLSSNYKDYLKLTEPTQS